MPSLTAERISYFKKKYTALDELIEQRQSFEKKQNDPIYQKFATTIDFPNIEGASLIHYAVIMGDLDTVKLLQADGASLSLKHATLEITPLQLAYQYGHPQIVEYLHHQGIDISEAKREFIDIESMQKLYDTQVFNTKLKPIADVSFLSTNEIIPFKLENDETRSFLNYVAEIGDEFFLRKFIRQHPNNQLLQTQIQSNLIDNGKDKLENPLITAIKNKQHGVLKLLLDYINPNLAPTSIVNNMVIQHQFFTSALHVAASEGDWASAEMLLKKGALLNQKDNMSYTPIFHALENGHEEFAKKLLEYGPSLDDINYKEENIFHAARNCSESIKKLIRERIKDNALENTPNLYGIKPTDEPPTKDYKQYVILNKIKYFFALNYLSTEYLNIHEGMCNGFPFIHEYYSSKNKESYYYEILENIINWDGNELSLAEKPKSFIHKNIHDVPIEKEFSSLKELILTFSTWLAWYQHDEELSHKGKPPTGILSSDRQKQFEGDVTMLIKMYRPEISHFDQLCEYAQIFSRLPLEVRIESVIAGHAVTCTTVQNNHFKYYEANLENKVSASFDENKISKIILNVQRHFTGREHHFICEFNQYYFEWNNIDFTHYRYFKENEYPTSAEQAIVFQQKSANKFTPLHVAALAHSKEDIEKLLLDGFCDINAKDAHGMTAFDIAAHSNDLEFCKLLLAHPDLNLTNTLAVMHAYVGKNRKIFEEILAHEKSNNLLELMMFAIENKQLKLIKYLFENKKVDINDDNFHLTKTLVEQELISKADIINFLIENFYLDKENWQNNPQTFQYLFHSLGDQGILGLIQTFIQKGHDEFNESFIKFAIVQFKNLFTSNGLCVTQESIKELFKVAQILTSPTENLLRFKFYEALLENQLLNSTIDKCWEKMTNYIPDIDKKFLVRIILDTFSFSTKDLTAWKETLEAVKEQKILGQLIQTKIDSLQTFSLSNKC